MLPVAIVKNTRAVLLKATSMPPLWGEKTKDDEYHESGVLADPTLAPSRVILHTRWGEPQYC